MKNLRTSETWTKNAYNECGQKYLSIYNSGTFCITLNVLSPATALQVRPFCRPLLREYLFV